MNKNTHEDEGHDSIETIVHEEKMDQLRITRQLHRKLINYLVSNPVLRE